MSWLNKSASITRDLIEFVNDVDLLELSYDETIRFLIEFLTESNYRDIQSIIIKGKIRQNFPIKRSDFWPHLREIRNNMRNLMLSFDEGYESDY